MSGTRPAGAEKATTPEAPGFECMDAVGAPAGPKGAGEGTNVLSLLGYLLIGIFLGFVFIMSEVVSWYRIQEMFRFQSVHMYGIIGTAVGTAAVSLQLIKRLHVRTLGGDAIQLPAKEWGGSRLAGARYWLGGAFFGMGWALLGACPGPIFALLGSGITVMVVALASAMAGTWTYAALRSHLPH